LRCNDQTIATGTLSKFKKTDKEIRESELKRRLQAQVAARTQLQQLLRKQIAGQPTKLTKLKISGKEPTSTSSVDERRTTAAVLIQ
jgi:hypothetical protein